jgi:hypothetical protein
MADTCSERWAGWTSGDALALLNEVGYDVSDWAEDIDPGLAFGIALALSTVEMTQAAVEAMHETRRERPHRRDACFARIAAAHLRLGRLAAALEGKSTTTAGMAKGLAANLIAATESIP